MAGCTMNVTCPKCKKPFVTRIRWGEDSHEKCPSCKNSFYVDQHRLTQELRKLGADQELSILE